MFFITACGYTLQKKGDLPFEYVSIGSITNLTYEPKLQDKMISSLTETLSSYGFYISPNARYRLDGEINKYNLRVLSELSLTASEYEVDVSGVFKLTDLDSGKVYPITILKPFSTHFTTQERLEKGLVQKEIFTKKALNEISQEIARYIIYSLPIKEKAK